MLKKLLDDLCMVPVFVAVAAILFELMTHKTIHLIVAGLALFLVFLSILTLIFANSKDFDIVKEKSYENRLTFFFKWSGLLNLGPFIIFSLIFFFMPSESHTDEKMLIMILALGSGAFMTMSVIGILLNKTIAFLSSMRTR